MIIPRASQLIPAPLGTAAAGTSGQYADAGHVHASNRVASFYNAATVSTAASSAAAVSLGTTNAFTVVSGRYYRVCVSGQLHLSNSAADIASVMAKIDSIAGTQIHGTWLTYLAQVVAMEQMWEFTVLGAAATAAPSGATPATIAAGSHAINISYTKNSGTGNTATGNWSYGSIFVTDVGV